MAEEIKLSSIIIAKNEENNIGRCIKSQLDCIDEIFVLVDNKSEDKTLEIVNSFENVKVEKVEWKGYSATKQYGVDKAKYNWIFWIDADEELTPELCNEINEFKKSVPEFSAYQVPRLANFLGRWIKHSGWYPGYVNRFFNKEKVRFSESDVHEHLVVSGETGKFKNDLLHYTDPNSFHYFSKFNRYTTLAADELHKNGKRFKLSDILLRPIIIFVKMYLLKKGFLDGIQGLILAAFSSSYVFTKYCKLWEIENKIDA